MHGADWALLPSIGNVPPFNGWVGHAGYGGQFLMINMASERVAAFLSMLENESGYDEDYMLDVITKLEALCVG